MFLSLLLLAAPLAPSEVPDPPPVAGTWSTASYDSRLVVPDPPPVAALAPAPIARSAGVGLVLPIQNVAPPGVRHAPFVNPARPPVAAAGYSSTRITSATAAGRVSTSSAGAGRAAPTRTLAGGAGTFGIISARGCSSGG